MTEMPELNKKLLKFAGFEILSIVPRTEGSMWPDIDMTGFAVYPGKTRTGIAPIFLDDLNACFEWLEKPLVDYFIANTSSEIEYKHAYFSFLCNWLANYILDEPHKPALALCQAIELLIDKKSYKPNEIALVRSWLEEGP